MPASGGTQQQPAEVTGPSQELTEVQAGRAHVELTEIVAIGASKATEVHATGAIHRRELAADAASKGSTEIAAIGTSKELTPVQVDSTSVQSTEIGVSGTSQEL